MQKLELEGYCFKITLQAQTETCDREWGEYGMFFKTCYGWNGLGVIQVLDTSDIRTFSFTTGFGPFDHSLLDSIFNTQRALSWGESLAELAVDQKKIIDWLAEKIMEMREGGVVRIPDLNKDELVKMGAIADGEGQLYLGI